MIRDGVLMESRRIREFDTYVASLADIHCYERCFDFVVCQTCSLRTYEIDCLMLIFHCNFTSKRSSCSQPYTRALPYSDTQVNPRKSTRAESADNETC